MKIAMMGFDFYSANKGCEALTISFVNLLKEVFAGNDTITVFNYSYSELGELTKEYPEINFVQRRPSLKKIGNWKKIKKEFDEMDCIVDITFGDGFSDIYGKKWNVITDIMKSIACKSTTPFILLPQTYGPYKNILLKKWAIWIIKKSTKAYSRDTESAVEFNKLTNNKICPVTDLAFALPYDEKMYSFNKDVTRVGINVSSLLWDSEYAVDNRFGLKVNYKDYINGIIKSLLQRDKTEIHLIPHVIDKKEYNAPENDYRSCNELKHGMYFDSDRVILAPAFDSPVEAKSYISQMDVFVGARMHSTIGALSTGVVTIPFAYSKKFKTLFGDLKYNYVVEARELSTSQAVDKTIEIVNKMNDVKEEAESTKKIMLQKLDIIKNDIRNWVK